MIQVNDFFETQHGVLWNNAQTDFCAKEKTITIYRANSGKRPEKTTTSSSSKNTINRLKIRVLPDQLSSATEPLSYPPQPAAGDFMRKRLSRRGSEPIISHNGSLNHAVPPPRPGRRLPPQEGAFFSAPPGSGTAAERKKREAFSPAVRLKAVLCRGSHEAQVSF